MNNKEYKYFCKLACKYEGYIEDNIYNIKLLMYLEFNKKFSIEEIQEARIRFNTDALKLLQFIFEEE